VITHADVSDLFDHFDTARKLPMLTGHGAYKLSKETKILIYIKEVPGSNLGQNTGYAEVLA
jgi:hypothetical protein